MQSKKQNNIVVSGNEAASLAVRHSGVTAAYAYPGTPSTELMEYIISSESGLGFWCANEKTALEAALGVSFAGGRSFVSMKHVGLNVAADPLMSCANVKINGGIAIVVADDPGMHSSQNEQDTRYLADFAKVPCYDPATVQDAYDMIRDAYELSEQLFKPVIVRMCTRLSHSKGVLQPRDAQPKVTKAPGVATEWNVVPAFAKKGLARALEKHTEAEKLSENSIYNTVNDAKNELGVITTGLAREYFLELEAGLPHLHIGFYPAPSEKIRNFVSKHKKILVLEEGSPYIERFLRGLLPTAQIIQGKMDNTLPLIGELNSDIIKKALGIPVPSTNMDLNFTLSNRPPQLCVGCPHRDTFNIIKDAIAGEDVILNADIGCYSLGALPPYGLPITLVDMGASIPMAKGAAQSGKKTLAIIGDSTFLHSGITGLIDCVNINAPVTVLILDNQTTAMTGGQPQLLPSERLTQIAEGIGVPKEHVIEFNPMPKHHQKNVELLKKEMAYAGVSVLIGKRECIETYKRGLKK